MNTFMYEHFLTERQIKILKEDFKFTEIPSVVKMLKCGDIGIGGIADTTTIFDKVYSILYN
jgi:phosphopantothenoylcysteine synthetase/decarboxylase